MRNFFCYIVTFVGLSIFVSCQSRSEMSPLERLVDDYIQRVNPGFLDRPWVEGDTLSVIVAFGLPEDNHYLQMDSVEIDGAIAEVHGVLNFTPYSCAYPPLLPPPPPPFKDSVEWVTPDIQSYPIIRCLGYTLFGPKLIIITVQDGVPDEYVRPFLDGITLYDLQPRADADLLLGSDAVFDYNDKKFMRGEFGFANIFQLDTLGHGNYIRWHYK